MEARTVDIPGGETGEDGVIIGSEAMGRILADLPQGDAVKITLQDDGETRAEVLSPAPNHGEPGLGGEQPGVLKISGTTVRRLDEARGGLGDADGDSEWDANFSG